MRIKRRNILLLKFLSILLFCTCIGISTVLAGPFEKKEIKPGESYEVVNISKEEDSFDIKGYGYYDYIIYDTKGNIKRKVFSTNYNTHEIPAGYKMIITSSKNNEKNISLEVVSGSFRITKSNTPAFRTIALKAGESVEISNTSKIDYEFKFSSYGFYSYVIYDKVYSKIERAKAYTNYDTGTIKSGNKMILTTSNKNEKTMTFAVPYKESAIKSYDYKAFEDKTFEAGDTHTIYNTCDKEQKFVITNSGYYGYLIYNRDGKQIRKETSTNYKVSSIPAGGKLVFYANEKNDNKIIVSLPYPHTNRVQSVDFKKKSIDIDEGKSMSIEYKITPNYDEINKELTWKSSDTSIVEVADGKIKAISSGKATITATTVDFGKEFKLEVNVKSLIDWKIEKPLKDQATDKMFKLELENHIDLKTIKNKEIYITDKNNKKISLYMYQAVEEDKKPLYIVPMSPLAKGEKYILWVKTIHFNDIKTVDKKTSKEVTEKVKSVVMNTKTVFEIKK